MDWRLSNGPAANDYTLKCLADPETVPERSHENSAEELKSFRAIG